MDPFNCQRLAQPTSTHIGRTDREPVFDDQHSPKSPEHSSNSNNTASGVPKRQARQDPEILPTMNMPPSKAKNLPTVSDCDSCGICCLHMGYPSYVSSALPGQDPAASDRDEQAWVEMPEPLKQQLISYIQNYQPPPHGELDGPCVWYDTSRRRCMHHEHRPQVCRDFSVGGKGCLEWRNHYRSHHPDYLPA